MTSPKQSYLKELLVAAYKALGQNIARTTGTSGLVNAASSSKGAISTGTLIALVVRNLVLGVVGVGCGVWSGMTGMSAAIPCNPIMTWLIGLRDSRLNAVSIAVTLGASATALLAFGHRHLISLPLAIAFALASVIGSLIGSAQFLKSLRDTRTARGFWGISVAVGGILLALKPGLIDNGPSYYAFLDQPYAGFLRVLIAGLLVGLYGRLSSSGPAALVPALVLCTNMGLLPAIAVALCAYILVSIIPALGYFSNDATKTAPFAWPLIGAAIGGIMGSHLALTLNHQIIVDAYGAGLILLGLGLTLSSFKTQTTGNDISRQTDA